MGWRFLVMLRPVWLALAAGFVASMTMVGGCTKDHHHDDGDCDDPPPPCQGSTKTGDETICQAGRCRVVIPPRAIAPGQTISIAETPVPPILTSETIADFMCRLDLPAADQMTAPVTLIMDLKGPNLPADSTLFRHQSPAAFGVSSFPRGGAIHALVDASGSYGATRSPSDWSVELTAPSDPLASSDTKSLVRNISLQSINAAYWDGTRFYLGDGPRVLIYNGIPAGPHVKPSIVIGQPELDRIVPGTSASILNTVGAIWSNGKKLVVANGHRVLIWNTIPTSDFAPADLVLGQQDFVAKEPNIGGVSGSTLQSPRGLDSDGTRLLIADTLNNRVLVWEVFPTNIGQSATSVLGQATLSANGMGQFYQAWDAKLDGAGAFVASYYTGGYHFPSLTTNALPNYTPLRVDGASRVLPDTATLPSSMTKTSTGGLATFDTNARIAMHRIAPTTTTTMDFVLGQPDPNRVVEAPPNGSSMSHQARAIAANGLLLVPDLSRVLVYQQPPTFNFEPASRVIAQAGFSTNDRGIDYRRISSRTLGYPSDVATNGDTLAIADRANNRVLLYPAAGLPATNAPATVVVGQPDMSSFVPNIDQVTPSASTLSGPGGVALSATHLIVADTENHRVLVWTPVPTTSGTPASFVLGQSSFSARRPNHGRGDANGDGYSDAGDNGFFFPTGVATDGVRLFVADRLNHRVLVWSSLAALSNDKPADGVIGQGSFADVVANRGAGGFHPRLDGLNLPTGVTLSGSTLWVADTENNRVVRYDNATTSTPTPARVIGQPDGSSITNLNYWEEGQTNVGVKRKQPTTAASVLRPRSVVSVGNLIYVSETDSNRVHVFDGSGGTYVHRAALGQLDDAGGAPNANGISAASLSAPLGLATSGTRLYAADSANHRVLGFDVPAVPLNNAPSSIVIGQTLAVASGFNQSAAVTAGGATRPRGLAIEGGELFVVETSRHRIAVHDLPLVPAAEPKRLIGQSDPSLSLPNAGGAPTAATLSSPRGVFADSQRVVVADTGNHRVLVYPRTIVEGSPLTASLVLGQATFGENASNRGGAPSASTLSAPESVYTDGQVLAVADTGNHRVLIWTSFPTLHGQPADFVIGQADFAANLTNRGTGLATSSTLALPAGVLIASGKLFIADSGNNRVLVHELGALSSNGVAASMILGQSNATGRIPTADINNTEILAGPISLTSDNANLYVADRDTNRVVAFDIHALTTGGKAIMLFNANRNLVGTGPGGLAVERTALFTSRLFVADTNNDQLLVLGPVSRLR